MFIFQFSLTNVINLVVRTLGVRGDMNTDRLHVTNVVERYIVSLYHSIEECEFEQNEYGYRTEADFILLTNDCKSIIQDEVHKQVNLIYKTVEQTSPLNTTITFTDNDGMTIRVSATDYQNLDLT